MNNHCIVRIVRASDQPIIPKLTPILEIKLAKQNEKSIKLVLGSTLGIVAGFLIYGMLKTMGLDLTGSEPLVIVGLPSALCALTAFVMY